MDRLKKSKDFKKVYNRGKSLATYNLVLYYYPNRTDTNRLGFSISTKVGNAVVRNKIRRRLREIIRLKENLKRGYDLIIIARKPVVNLDYKGLERDVNKLFKKANLFTSHKGIRD